MTSMDQPQPQTPIRQVVFSLSSHSYVHFISESWITARGEAPSSSRRITTVVCAINWSISSPLVSVKPLPSLLKRLLKQVQGQVSMSCSSRTVKPVFCTRGYLREESLNSCVPSLKCLSVQIQGRKLAMLGILGQWTTAAWNSILLLAMNLLLQTPQLIFLGGALRVEITVWQLLCLLRTASKGADILAHRPSMVFLKSSQFSLSRSRTWQFWAEKLLLMSWLMYVGFLPSFRLSATFYRLQTVLQQRENSFSGYSSSTFSSSSFSEASSFSRRVCMALVRQLFSPVWVNLRLAESPRLSVGYLSSCDQWVLRMASAGQQKGLQSVGCECMLRVVRQRSLSRRQCGFRQTMQMCSSQILLYFYMLIIPINLLQVESIGPMP